MVSTVTSLPRLGRHLQRGQRAPGVAGGQLHQQVDGVVGDLDLAAEPARVVDGAVHHGADVVGGERLQLQDQRPRQQRRDDRERRVLRGGRDQQHHPVLDGGQQRVLLGLGEPVHLVDEQHGLLAVRGRPAGDVDDGADLLDPGRQRRQRLEPAAGRLRDQRRQRRLAGARRAVEDDRRRTRPLDQPAQRRARLQQVVLADDLVEGRRPHPHRQRGRRADGASGAAGRGRLAGDVEQTVGHALCLPRALRRRAVTTAS